MEKSKETILKEIEKLKQVANNLLIKVQNLNNKVKKLENAN